MASRHGKVVAQQKECGVGGIVPKSTIAADEQWSESAGAAGIAAMDSTDVDAQVAWIMGRLTSWRMEQTLRVFESELKSMQNDTPADAPPAAPAAPASDAASTSHQQQQPQPQPPQQPATQPQQKQRVLPYPYEQNDTASPAAPANGLHYSPEAPLNTYEENRAFPDDLYQGVEEQDDEWGNQDAGFIRIEPRDPNFLREELWSPEYGSRPDFPLGAGITVAQHKQYMHELIDKQHKKLQQEIKKYTAPEKEGKDATETSDAATRAKPAEADKPTEEAALGSPASKKSARSARESHTDEKLSEAGDTYDGNKKEAPKGEEPPQQLEKFSLNVIYVKGKTGFEENQEYPVQQGHVIAGRYQILEYIGSAAFSHAVQCLDLKTDHLVCVKIIKNSKDFFDQSLDEIKLLQYINRSGDADENCVLQLYDYFYHKEHLFLVSELLRDNLYEFSKFIRTNRDPPYFTVQRLQKITKQVLIALSFVHRLNLMHCDLKPENILIRSFSRCEVKVIDFGSSCFTNDHLSSYVQSRCYRAPEVILGLPYGQAIDIWSLGAIIPELYTGKVLFYNDSVNTMLCRITAICGPFPTELMKGARHAHKYLTRSGVMYENSKRGMVDLLFPRPTSLKSMMGDDTEPLFIDFVESLLQIDPSKRPTAAEALKHPWLEIDYGPIPPMQ
ncbi:Dual specificity protein kinase pom1 [Diplonema papillatum]|nr:Dual specificity protein kinase pom1 [Diplonema papillatum]